MATPPAFQLPKSDYDAQLALYAEVLESVGFKLDGERPYSYPGVGGDWTSPEGWLYHAFVAVTSPRRPILGSLMRITSDPRKLTWLFECMELETPEELAWLLRRSVNFADAQQRAAYHDQARLPDLPPPKRAAYIQQEGGKYLAGLILEPLEMGYQSAGFSNPKRPH
jgi:hypothetical protein